ncbi:MAG: ATP-binding cassette domain-containing protein [Chloroflexota bacterium]|nr:ATP-binding cassette domain-containing protein [Chloroflexota bacterium]
MLEARELVVGYREGVDVLLSVSLRAEAGTITSVIGTNGSGKSTLLRCLYGLLPQRSGEVRFDGTSIGAWRTERRKEVGIGYLPQHHSTFPQLTVEQNLVLGGWLLRRDHSRLQRRIESLYELFPALREHRRARATTLSGGQLRMLALAKELVVLPRLLLVDEPSVGMSPRVATDLYAFLEQLPAQGVTVLLVDQNITDAVRIAQRVYLFGEGRVQREASGAWFATHLEEVVQQMLRGSFEA